MPGKPDPLLPGPVRIWEGDPSCPATVQGGLTTPADSGEHPAVPLHALARHLAEQEALRAPARRRGAGSGPEPLTLEWFGELEHARHRRQGRWVPPLLEFARHRGDRVLGLGGCLGSDWVQYASHGAEVITACPSGDQLALIRRNFELRGLPGTFLHASPTSLPLAPSSIDVVCLTGLLHDAARPEEVVAEVYRVLKPGGKVLAVVPAYYDVDYWGRWCYLLGGKRAQDLLRTAAGQSGLLCPNARRYRRRELLEMFRRFTEARTYKRHLRRAEVPYMWRWLPPAILQRFMGRLLVYKGFKPLSAALPSEQAAA